MHDLEVFPVDLSADRIREIGSRATKETKELQAKTDEMITRTRELVKRCDEMITETRELMKPMNPNNGREKIKRDRHGQELMSMITPLGKVLGDCSSKDLMRIIRFYIKVFGKIEAAKKTRDRGEDH